MGIIKNWMIGLAILGCEQGIIKVREWIPHIGLLTKVIPLKLFLDMAPSSWTTNGIKICKTTATNRWECRILSRPESVEILEYKRNKELNYFK